MSNQEQEPEEPVQVSVFVEGTDEEGRLRREKIARALGATVVIPVSSPFEAWQIYHHRQAAIRSQARREAESDQQIE